MPNDGLVWDFSTYPSQGLQGHPYPQGFHWLHPIPQSPGRCVAWFAWAVQGAARCENILNTFVIQNACRKQEWVQISSGILCYTRGSSV